VVPVPRLSGISSVAFFVLLYMVRLTVFIVAPVSFTDVFIRKFPEMLMSVSGMLMLLFGASLSMFIVVMLIMFWLFA